MLLTFAVRNHICSMLMFMIIIGPQMAILFGLNAIIVYRHKRTIVVCVGNRLTFVYLFTLDNSPAIVTFSC